MPMIQVHMPRRNRRRAGGCYTQFMDVDSFNSELETLPSGFVSNITAFQRSTTPPPASATTVNVAAEGMSEILCWAVGTTVYWYSARWNVYLPESAAYMFSWGKNVRTIDLTGVRSAKTRAMAHMFYSDSALQSLDLSGFDTSSVTDMERMFYICSSLTSLDVSSFDTSSVTNMRYMFGSCYSLTSLDLSSFDTSSVTDMERMFYNSSSLTSLDLSSFDTSSVTNMGYMFYIYGGVLRTIYASNAFVTTSVTIDSGMFLDCSNLVGGAGTTYDSSHTDKEYARIDGGTSAPGYFTLKA